MDKSKFYALSSPFPLYTYSDHLPLQWMSTSQKGPVSQFLIEQLSEIDYVCSYIEGRLNSISDAVSRFPLLGPRRLSPRGMEHSIQEMLKRIPVSLRTSKIIHVHAGPHTANARKLV
jgi:hypothetical protein